MDGDGIRLAGGSIMIGDALGGVLSMPMAPKAALLRRAEPEVRLKLRGTKTFRAMRKTS